MRKGVVLICDTLEWGFNVCQLMKCFPFIEPHDWVGVIEPSAIPEGCPDVLAISNKVRNIKVWVFEIGTSVCSIEEVGMLRKCTLEERELCFDVEWE